MSDNEHMRRDFEQWISRMNNEIASNHWVSLEKSNGRYESIDVELAWRALQYFCCSDLEPVGYGILKEGELADVLMSKTEAEDTNRDYQGTVHPLYTHQPKSS